MNIDFPNRTDLRELLCQVQAEYDKQVNRVEYFRKKCIELRNGAEIRKLEDEIKRLRRLSLHVMSEKELEDEQHFRDHHYRHCGNGNSYRYELTGTGIGTAISVICPVCGECKNITDTGGW